MHNERQSRISARCRRSLTTGGWSLCREAHRGGQAHARLRRSGENFEYKAAKQAQNKNRSRIRYLEGMIKSAKVISDTLAPTRSAFLTRWRYTCRRTTRRTSSRSSQRCAVTRASASSARSRPSGQQVLGKKVGDRFTVKVDDSYSYVAEIRAITKCEDDGPPRC